MGKFLFGKGTVESLPPPPNPRNPKFLLNMVYFGIEFIETGYYLVDWEVQNG